MTNRVSTRTARAALVLVAAILSPGRQASAQYLDRARTFLALADQLEYGGSASGKPVQWDVAGWVGDSYDRLWVKSEGDWKSLTGTRAFDLRAEYSRLVAPFWELQGGVRFEVQGRGGRTDTRTHLSLGLLGLAPYWFELEPEIFIAQDGQVAGRLTAEYEMLLTQRLIAQPRFETYAAASENERFGVGSGLNYVEPGVRIRYEIRRELAPYIGVDWVRRFGGTARFARSAGETATDFALVFGLRAWR